MDIIISLLPILIVLVGIIVLNKPAKLVAPIAFVVTFIFGKFYFNVGLDVLWKNRLDWYRCRYQSCLHDHGCVLYS